MSDEKDKSPPMYSAEWWAKEVAETEKELSDKLWTAGDKVVDLYLAESDDEETEKNRYNVFWANTQIIKSALYATPPKPRVTRQFGDAKDDVARTAALILERILNFGMSKDQSDMHDAFSQAAEDRLIPGLGQVWLRYDVEIGKKQIPDEFGNLVEAEVITYENVATDYVHWRDFLWSPARTWEEVWWVGRRVWMTEKKLTKRFGETKVKKLKQDLEEVSADSPHLPKGFKKGKYEIIELWCEATNKAYWIHKHCKECLDEKEDPLQLEEFFPCPKPLLGTHTSKTVIPRSEYSMSQDQYRELNVLNDRIYTLTEALRVVGVFDKGMPEMKDMLKSKGNVMIPVEKWAALAEKGGLKGVIDWFPVEIIAGVLEKLVVQRQQVVQQIYELTSISDIMRGASNPRETLGAQKLKSQYSSVRLQLMQQDVGRFVRHAMRIKSEIVCKHFQPETIASISGIQYTESAMFAQPAIEMLKGDYKSTQYRIEVGEETLSIADYNAERELRTELLTAVGQFLSQSAQLVTSMPNAMPYLLKMIAWLVSSFKGSADIESVLDEAITQATQNPPKPEGDGKPDKGPELQLQAQIAQMETQSTERLAMAEMQLKKQMNDDNNQTKVLIEQLKQGIEDQKLAMEALNLRMEQMNIQEGRQHESSEAAQEREHSAQTHQLDLDHAAEQGEADRQSAASQARAKNADV